MRLLTDHSDVVAVFPSVQRLDTIFVPVCIVVKKALGFIPKGEQPTPPVVEGVLVVLVEGFVEEFVRAGDALGNVEGPLGFGTIGGIVRRRDTGVHFAITCKHVVEKAKKDGRNGRTSLVTPPPAWRKFALLKALNQHLFTADGKFVANLDTLFLEAICSEASPPIRNYMQALCLQIQFQYSEGVTVQDLRNFTSLEATHICDVREAVCLGAMTISGITMDGDIALLPMNSTAAATAAATAATTELTKAMFTMDALQQAWDSNDVVKVIKTGASTGKTEGIVARPSHVKADGQLYTTFRHNLNRKETGSSEPVVYRNQVLIHGRDFGKKGDSGSLVCAGQKLVGVFTGSLDGSIMYLASPICCIPSMEYEWVEKS